MKRRRPTTFAIIGAGKVGTVLGKVLAQRGAKIVAVVSRSLSSAQKAGRFLGCKNASTSLSAIPVGTDFILVTTPHAAVEQVALDLSRTSHLDFNNLAVCHASGMLTAEVLEPVRRRGATVFSFHPLQTFPRGFPVSKIVPTARGIYYGVDGTAEGVQMAKSLAGMLEGKVMVIPPERRAFYHAACVLASNHFATMLSILEMMFRTLKTSEKKFYPVFEPIVMATLRNIKSTSPAEALSGPIARGGVETVAEHFRVIKSDCPQLIPYFACLSLETVNLALEKGSIDKMQAGTLRSLIHSYEEPNAYHKETP